MSRRRHTALLISSELEAEVIAATERAMHLGLVTSGIVTSRINGLRTVMIAPSGCYVSWCDHTAPRRAKLVECLRAWRATGASLQWVEVTFGDELAEPPQIVSHSGDDGREG